MTTTTTLDVDGMVCDGCENSVKLALAGLAGVEVVYADHETKTVRVEHDPDAIDETALGEAIEAIGFELIRD